MLRWQRRRQKRHRAIAVAATLVATVFVTTFVSRSIGSGREVAAVSAAPFVPVPPSPHELAEQFLDASSHYDRIALLRDPRSAHAMRDHFEFVSAKGIEAERVALQPMAERFDNGLTYHPFLVQFADGRDRYLTVVDGAEGRYIDWDAYERTGTASWQQLLDGKVDVAKVRVVVSPDDFYNRGFEDTSAYECLRLTTPDIEGSVYAYVDFHSKAQKIVHDVFHRMRRDALMASKMSGAALGPEPVNSLRFTLAIRSVEGSHAHRQFLVERVVAGGWVESAAGDLQDTWIESDKDDHFDEIEMLVQNNALKEHQRRVSALPARTMTY